LVLQHEQAPPNPGLRTLNPKIAEAVEGYAVRFPEELESLRELAGQTRVDGAGGGYGSAKRLVAGVSSFGFAGTIAHAILSQAPPDVSRDSWQSSWEEIKRMARQGVQRGRDVVFVFTGQGSQYEGMGQGLYESEGTFREAMDRCEAVYES
ncbi:MAG: acyltransferase domain-containing protein, partial [bacterium]